MVERVEKKNKEHKNKKMNQEALQRKNKGRRVYTVMKERQKRKKMCGV